MEMSYREGAYGVNRMVGESNESVHERFGVSSKTEVMNCGVEDAVKRCSTRTFGHLKRRMGEDEMTRMVHKSRIDAVGAR